MSKFVRADFLRGAEACLPKQNFPGVYKNAIAALALGDVRATYYLCEYYRHQMDEGRKTGVPNVAEATTNFCIMYQLTENYRSGDYMKFKGFHAALFSKIQFSVQHVTKNMVVEYTKYLQTAQMKYSEGTVVDIRTAEHQASVMEQNVLQQAMQNSQAQALEMSAPPPPPSHYHQGYDQHHPGQHTPLLGQHEEKCWDKLPCAIL